MIFWFKDYHYYHSHLNWNFSCLCIFWDLGIGQHLFDKTADSLQKVKERVS